MHLRHVDRYTNNMLGQKIKLVIAACLWNNPQVCRGRLSVLNLTLFLDLCSR